MTLYKRRKKFDSVSIKIGLVFSKIPLTPNQWTIFSLLPALLGFIAVYLGNVTAAIILFAATAFFDIIDGSVARVMGKATVFGAYLDTIVDRYIEFIMIFSLIFLDLPNFYFPISYWILALLFGSMLSTYAKSASAEKNIVKKDGHGIKGGLLEHTDRLILLFAIFLAFPLIGGVYTSFIVLLFSIIANISALQRILYVWKISKISVG